MARKRKLDAAGIAPQADVAEENPQESRKEWLTRIFLWAGKKNTNNVDWQFWRQDNHPIELFTNEIQTQKLDYIHQNPVVSGFTDRAEAWLYSSARDYAGEKGLLPILFIDSCYAKL